MVLQQYMDSEIRAIMAQYMPLDSQAEVPNHVNNQRAWKEKQVSLLGFHGLLHGCGFSCVLFQPFRILTIEFSLMYHMDNKRLIVWMISCFFLPFSLGGCWKCNIMLRRGTLLLLTVLEYKRANISMLFHCSVVCSSISATYFVRGVWNCVQDVNVKH